MLQRCAVLSAQRLSGPVESDKATDSGLDLKQKVNAVLLLFVFGCMFHTLARRSRKGPVIHQDRGVCHRLLLSHKSLDSGVDC